MKLLVSLVVLLGLFAFSNAAGLYDLVTPSHLYAPAHATSSVTFHGKWPHQSYGYSQIHPSPLLPIHPIPQPAQHLVQPYSPLITPQTHNYPRYGVINSYGQIKHHPVYPGFPLHHHNPHHYPYYPNYPLFPIHPSLNYGKYPFHHYPSLDFGKHPIHHYPNYPIHSYPNYPSKSNYGDYLNHYPSYPGVTYPSYPGLTYPSITDNYHPHPRPNYPSHLHPVPNYPAITDNYHPHPTPDYPIVTPLPAPGFDTNYYPLYPNLDGLIPGLIPHKSKDKITEANSDFGHNLPKKI